MKASSACRLRLATCPVLVLCLIAVWASPALRAQDGAERGGGLRQINDDLVSVFESVAPSVVVVNVTKQTPEGMEEGMLERFGFDFFLRERAPDDGGGEPEDGRGMPVPGMPETEGSGVIYDGSGHIVTNFHVVEEARKVEIVLKDGRVFEAKLVGADRTTDIAVLKIKADDLKPAQFANSDTVRIGQLVCAIGAPYELDYSFTLGVVSGLKRSNLLSGGSNAVYEEYIQSDASINPGNSGGPLIDIDGRIIGINALINGINRGLSFSIPSNIVRRVADQLIEKGKVEWSWVGIRIETLRPSSGLHEHFEGIDKGVVVETIEPDTPAYRSELRPADVITAVDGEPCHTAQRLQKLILEKPVGSRVELSVWRDGKLLTVEVVTEARPGESESTMTLPPAVQDEKPTGNLPDFGLHVQELTAELASRLELGVDSGILVTEVDADTPADIAGILPNDVITEVDSRKVGTVEEFNRVLAKADAGRGILLLLARGGEQTHPVLPPGR